MKVLLGTKNRDGPIVRQRRIVRTGDVGQCRTVHGDWHSHEPAGVQTAILGFGTKRVINSAQKGQFGDLGNFRTVHEFALGEGETVERGTVTDVTIFAEGDVVNVVGVSKGHGFQVW